MALKQKHFTIEKGNDAGKTFLITAMPLLKADRWAQRFGLGMMRGGLNVGGLNGVDFSKMNLKNIDGILEIARVGMGALGNIEESIALELIQELTESCLKIVPSNGVAREIEWDSDIEDVATIMLLRAQALSIHHSFLPQGES